MEPLIATLAGFGVFLVGLLARLAVLPVILAVLSIPVLLALMGVRGFEMLRQRVLGVARVDGLTWKPDLYYTFGHSWLYPEGEAVRVGLDDLAQRVLAGAEAVALPHAGAELHEGDVAAVITCGDKHAAIPSPVAGMVTAVNDAVQRDPSVIQRDPYVRGWLFSVSPSKTRFTRLLRGDAARDWLTEESTRLARFLEQNLGVATADGGEFVLPPPALLTEAQWNALTKAFLNDGRSDVIEADSTMLVTKDDGHLPRALVPLAAVAAAIAGGIYIILLPLIGFALLLGLSALWLLQAVAHGVYRLRAPVDRTRRP